MLCIGRARHHGPGRPPGPPGISVEFIKGGLALESDAHFLAVAAQKLIPARGRHVTTQLRHADRLTCEKIIRPHLRARRPLSGATSPASIGHERRRCQFIHGLFRSLGHLTGGLARFIPCEPDAHSTRLS